jgi:hypothetical protein
MQLQENRTGRRGGRPRVARRKLFWTEWSTEELLDLRLNELGVTLEGTWLESMIDRTRGELRTRGLRFRPGFWLSDEWFSPEGVPGVALPFYLAHPRLMRLERNRMLEVEGGNREDCLQLLRHELGHAVQHAYGLHRRRRWQRAFGKSTLAYPDFYRPDPASKNFVQHLDAWYAQAHPVEDFAETFAVWLRPGSDWRRRYRGWPALSKLELVDELMSEIAGLRPQVTTRARPDSLPRLRKTLREHYTDKRERYSVGFTDDYDRELKSLFSAAPGDRDHETASAFLRRNRRELRLRVSRWTGEYQFTLDQVLKQMIGRCRELGLRAAGSERRLMQDFAIVLTMHTMRCLHRGGSWHAL